MTTTATMRHSPGRSADHRAALTTLRTLADPLRLRVKADAEGWPVIPGRLGQLEHHDGHLLAVYTDRPRLFAKLWAVHGVQRHQTGDGEMRTLLPVDALAAVAGIIRARRRRVLTPEQRDERARRLEEARRPGEAPREGSQTLTQSDLSDPGSTIAPNRGAEDGSEALGAVSWP